MTVSSFAITLYDQCWRRHVVGQLIVSDINIVRISICSLCSESNNNISLLFIAVLGTSTLLHISNIH